MDILSSFCFGSAGPVDPVIVVTTINGENILNGPIYGPSNVRLVKESDDYGAILINSRLPLPGNSDE